MGSEIEITETPNWLKELEAKRERRLKTKLGHELGAGAPCLTCEEKCPGLDLHFWRKICKNCKCPKENHEVQDDDIYGWAQDELLGTKVNRLKRKIVLPGRNDEVELEWAPNGPKETIDKYLKTLPPEQLPIKGSQAAQDRKQLLKKQIPVHDIDPTLCHELTDEELKKMQDYVTHIKESSVGVGHLIQINFNKGKTHILDKNDAMFLINNVPKGVVSSENVLLQGGNSSVPLKNFANKFGSLDLKEKQGLGIYEPNSIISGEIDEQNPIFANIRDKHYNIGNSIDKSGLINLKQGRPNVYDPENNKILTEDVQIPQDTSLRSLNYPENIYEHTSEPNEFSNDQNKILNPTSQLYGNSNIKNLVPSAFVPTKYLNESCQGVENQASSNLDKSSVKELPYPSKFINEQFKYGRCLPNYNPGAYNTFNEHQNPAFFEPIKDVRYSPSQNVDPSLRYPQERPMPNYGHMPNDPLMPSSGLSGQDIGSGGTTYSNNPEVSLIDPLRADKGANRPNLGQVFDKSLHYPQESQLSGGPDISKESVLKGSLNQTASPLPHLIHGKRDLYEDSQKPATIKSIKDLAYSTYDSPPDGAREEDFHNLSVKDRLNMIKKGELPAFRPSNSPILDRTLSPSKFSARDKKGILYDGEVNPSAAREHRNSPPHFGYQSSPSRGATSEDLSIKNPILNKELHSPNKGYGTLPSRDILENDIPGKENWNRTAGRQYSNLPAYAPGSKNICEDDIQPSFIPVGGIRDLEYENPEIRTAVSKDNDLFEGLAPNKFIPNFDSANLPSCHYCNELFKQDELAIAIPERSEAIFHTNCFKCHGCNQVLADMFYFYDKESDNVYCGRDYAKIRGIPRCRACDELIFVKEYCLAENSTFHVKHFCCFECDKPLAGQNYVMENDQPLCVPCYELTKANKCYACKEVIHPDQQGLQLKDGVHFHATEDCFACKVCTKSLFGAKLLFRKDTLYCSHDCYNSDI